MKKLVCNEIWVAEDEKIHSSFWGLALFKPNLKFLISSFDNLLPEW
jgi:hypothetical protein